MLRREDVIKMASDRKLTINLDGPYIVGISSENESYILEALIGEEIPRTENAEKFIIFYRWFISQMCKL